MPMLSKRMGESYIIRKSGARGRELGEKGSYVQKDDERPILFEVEAINHAKGV